MKEIIIKTQKKLDKLPDSFKEYTIIKIKSQELIIVKKHYTNSTVKALGNSTVEAWGNSTVVALGNSTVKAWGNSTVKALGNSTVKALDNSTVEAWGNSTVKALGNSTVKALDNSTVEAWGNSTVKALDNSTVEAWGNSTVVALGNSTVKAWDNSTISAFEHSYILVLSVMVILQAVKHLSIIRLLDINKKDIKIVEQDKTATIIKQKRFKHNITTFWDIYGEKKKDEIVLYKVTREDDFDHWTQTVKYKEGTMVECPDFDSNTVRECGGGLHLSPTPELAKSYNRGKLKKCIVKKKDIVVYPGCIRKVRCRKVFVEKDLEE